MMDREKANIPHQQLSFMDHIVEPVYRWVWPQVCGWVWPQMYIDEGCHCVCGYINVVVSIEVLVCIA